MTGEVEEVVDKTKLKEMNRVNIMTRLFSCFSRADAVITFIEGFEPGVISKLGPRSVSMESKGEYSSGEISYEFDGPECENRNAEISGEIDENLRYRITDWNIEGYTDVQQRVMIVPTDFKKFSKTILQTLGKSEIEKKTQFKMNCKCKMYRTHLLASKQNKPS